MRFSIIMSSNDNGDNNDIHDNSYGDDGDDGDDDESTDIHIGYHLPQIPANMSSR